MILIRYSHLHCPGHLVMHFFQSTAAIQAFKQAILNNPHPQSLQNQQRQFKALEAFDGSNELKNIKASTLVAYGIEDLLSLPGESAFLAQQISTARLKEFDCAHMVQYEATQQLTHTLIEFLNN